VESGEEASVAGDRDAEFVAFAQQSTPRLLTAAWMLTGDSAAAEALAAEALERVYVPGPAWPTRAGCWPDGIPTCGTGDVARVSPNCSPSRVSSGSRGTSR
jgi:hypothetical protein